MRVLVCGGRDRKSPDDAAAVWERLTDMLPDHVITGGAPGIDTHAAEWARYHGVNLSLYEADWSTHGRAAGPLRNQRMLDDGKPDVVVAFLGGRGTADMVARARKAGVPVVEVGR